MEDEENQTSSMNTQKNSSVSWIAIVIVLVIVWFVLRTWAQSSVDSYNKCYQNAYSNTLSTQKSLNSMGYSKSDSTLATFDTYGDQVYNCSKQLPPSWIIFITGVHGR